MSQDSVLGSQLLLKLLNLQAGEHQHRAAMELCLRRLRDDSTSAKYHFSLALTVLTEIVTCCIIIRHFIPPGGGWSTGRLLLYFCTWIALAEIWGGVIQNVLSFVSEQKELGTLGLLKLTGIGAEGLIRSIFAYAMIQCFILFTLRLPVLFFIISLGSVTYPQFFLIVLILAFTAFPLAALGFCVSVVCKNRVTANLTLGMLFAMVFVSILILKGLTFAVRADSIPFLNWEFLAIALDTLADLLIYLTPFPHLLNVLSRGYLSLPLTLYFISSIFIGSAVLRLSVRHFESNTSQLEPQTFDIKRLEDLFQMKKPVKKLQQRRNSPSRCWDNPYVWREFHFQNGGWKRVAESSVSVPFIFAIMVGLIFWVASEASPQPPEFGAILFGFSIFWVVCTVVGSALAAVGLFSSVLTAEIKGKTLGTLFLVGRPSLEIVRELIRGRLLLLVHSVSPLMIGLCGLAVGFWMPQPEWMPPSEPLIHPLVIVGGVIAVLLLVAYLGGIAGLLSIRCELICSKIVRGVVYFGIAVVCGIGFVFLVNLVTEVARVSETGSPPYALISMAVLLFLAGFALIPILWQSIGRAIQYRMGQD